ncbi:unnamed protein product [Adineta steineri]|uniref:F-box domain-containing protein n=1 Tax=Adineta steineri TaxID=433720 RepID=A0A813VQ95_9BILA|nr:unnamed protein product [Adineta steineri]CAF3970254.1 unnamed protein product [Adineta steineri]
MSIRLEDFPNELLLNIFKYVDTRDLFDGFWQLNQRFNQLLQSLKKLVLIIEKSESKLISIFGCQIYKVIVDTCLDINFMKFSYLHSLVLYDITETHLTQIRTKFMPYLAYLSIPSNNQSWWTYRLIERIFSPELSSLTAVNLGYFPIFKPSHSYSDSIRSMTVYWNSPFIVFDILRLCPNLSYLRVRFHHIHNRYFPMLSSIIHHSLKYFILLDSSSILSFNHIDTLLQYIPNIERIRLNFKCDVPFIRLAQMISNRLSYLYEFNCYIDILPEDDDDMINLEIIRQIHPYFHHIQCNIDDFGCRTYITN